MSEFGRMDKSFEHMDNRFKKLDNELQFTYDKSFWNQAEQLLDDSVMDAAFKSAADVDAAALSATALTDIDDAFLDDAFSSAVDVKTYAFQPSFWQDFKANESTLVQDSAFVDAANQTKANYQAHYWNEANEYLKAEGLHHEYKSAYWKEAEQMLVANERSGFFTKWAVAATVLILLSVFGGQFYRLNQNKINQLAQQNGQEMISNESSQSLSDVNKPDFNSVNQNQLDQIFSTEFVSIQNIEKSNNLYGVVEAENQLNSSHLKNNDLNLNNSTSQQLSTTNNSATENENNDLIDFNNSQTDEINLVQNNDLNSTKDELVSDDHSETLTNVEKVKLNTDVTQITFKPSKELTQIIEIEDLPKPQSTHQLSITFAKGLGNGFNQDNLGELSARNTIYMTYDWSPLKFKNKWSFSFDLGMYHMHLNKYNYERHFTNYKYDGDVEHSWFKLSYKDLVSTFANANVNYHINNKHSVSAGLGIERLMTSKIQVEYQDVDDDLVKDLGNDWGINRGINKLDMQAILGYKYQLSQRFQFVALLKAGFFDKTNNLYLQRNSKERDYSAQIGFKYNIFSSH